MLLKTSNFVKTFRDLLGFGSKWLSAQTTVIDRGTPFLIQALNYRFLPQVSRIAFHDEGEAKEKGESQIMS